MGLLPLLDSGRPRLDLLRAEEGMAHLDPQRDGLSLDSGHPGLLVAIEVVAHLHTALCPGHVDHNARQLRERDHHEEEDHCMREIKTCLLPKIE